jgi:hypothetical protein
MVAQAAYDQGAAEVEEATGGTTAAGSAEGQSGDCQLLMVGAESLAACP